MDALASCIIILGMFLVGLKILLTYKVLDVQILSECVATSVYLPMIAMTFQAIWKLFLLIKTLEDSVSATR